MMKTFLNLKRLAICLKIMSPMICLRNCPLPETLGPHCSCWPSNFGSSLTCNDISDPEKLRATIKATNGYEVFGITISNSTLRYLPHNLFAGTSFKKIQFVDTALMSLSDRDSAFEGLENQLLELRATATSYVSQWHFTQLQHFKKLNLIDINSIDIETITEDFPEFPHLSAVGITNANLSHISDHIFAKCPRLLLVALNNNEISVLKRSMFPMPANYLAIINLQDNKLSTLPEDFFTEMPLLTDVLLANNAFITLDEKVFSDVLSRLNTLDMTKNPFVCDCHVNWLVKKKKTPTSFLGKCRQPASLRELPLQYLLPQHMSC